MAELRSLALSLYRKQLLLARALDAAPGLAALLLSSSLHTPPGAPPVAEEVAATAAAMKQRFFDQCGTRWYSPLSEHAVSAYVRAAYRSPSPVPSPSDAVCLDAALNVTREIMRIQGIERDEQANINASSVDLTGALGHTSTSFEEAPSIAPGCLLLEHPAATRPGRTVLLVFDISRNVMEIHGNEDWMLRAIEVNRPFPLSVASATGSDVLGALGTLPLFHGGTEGNELFVVHRRGDVPGAVPVDPLGEGAGAGTGLYLGGEASAINALLDSGGAHAHDFKVVQGTTLIKLEGGQADAGGDGEGLGLPDPGRWLCVRGAGTPSAVLLPPHFDSTGKWRDGAGMAAGDKVDGYHYGRFWHQNAVWSHVWRAAAASMDQSRAASWSSLAKVHTSVAHVLAAMGPLGTQLLATAPLAYAQAQEIEDAKAESQAQAENVGKNGKMG